jgi:hypothetical protein
MEKLKNSIEYKGYYISIYENTINDSDKYRIGIINVKDSKGVEKKKYDNLGKTKYMLNYDRVKKKIDKIKSRIDYGVKTGSKPDFTKLI